MHSDLLILSWKRNVSAGGRITILSKAHQISSENNSSTMSIWCYIFSKVRNLWIMTEGWQFLAKFQLNRHRTVSSFLHPINEFFLKYLSSSNVSDGTTSDLLINCIPFYSNTIFVCVCNHPPFMRVEIIFVVYLNWIPTQVIILNWSRFIRVRWFCMNRCTHNLYK